MARRGRHDLVWHPNLGLPGLRPGCPVPTGVGAVGEIDTPCSHASSTVCRGVNHYMAALHGCHAATVHRLRSGLRTAHVRGECRFGQTIMLDPDPEADPAAWPGAGPK